mmetsp:Transcript_27827/g.79934  ORF Transcript_27827/g.79934 Transcript_27827/m.79934 type:complete len:685 (-) Transcript_27827:36-2090(-)
MSVNDTQRIAQLEARLMVLADAVDTSWVLTASALVMLMQLGFAMLEAGTVREHNAVATYAKNVLDLVLGTVIAWSFGYAIAYNVHPLALDLTGDAGSHEPERVLFHIAFQVSAITIVSGAMAERVSVGAYGLIAMFVSMLYCVGVRFTWGGGWLSDRGFHDFAGSGVVHLQGGAAALAGAGVIGARTGRWNVDQRAEFVPHNPLSVLGGTLLLFVGWLGFTPGSTLGLSTAEQRLAAAGTAMVTVITASSATGVVAVWSLTVSRGRRLDILALSNSLLAGLVASTGGADVIDPPAAVAVGVVSTFVYYGAVEMRRYLRIDDVVDAFAVHGANGVWGLVAIGLFHRTDGLFTRGSSRLLAEQLLGAVVLAIITGVPTFAMALLLRRLGCLRVSLEEEAVGLDSAFGLRAYVTKSHALQRCSGAAMLLQERGYSPAEVVEALITLRDIIYRPFTPQAGDNKLEGEVMDILLHLVGNTNDRQIKHLAFLSHHKEDAGDGARIFLDTARRLLTNGVGYEGLRDLVDTIPGQDLIFLDSAGLKDLSKLCDIVGASANHILLLSRRVLERPWVLAELCSAHKCGMNLCMILIEYPGRRDDSKAFRFPEDLERAISDWTEFMASQAPPEARSRKRSLLNAMQTVVRRRPQPDLSSCSTPSCTRSSQPVLRSPVQFSRNSSFQDIVARVESL